MINVRHNLGNEYCLTFPATRSLCNDLGLKDVFPNAISECCERTRHVLMNPICKQSDRALHLVTKEDFLDDISRQDKILISRRLFRVRWLSMALSSTKVSIISRPHSN